MASRSWVLRMAATSGTLVPAHLAGVMPMTNVLSGPKAGTIGPIRREIIFEPLPDDTVPNEPPPVTPEKPVPVQVPAPT
jgi:hypothetical protein